MMRRLLVPKLAIVRNLGYRAIGRQANSALEALFDVPFYAARAAQNFETPKQALDHYRRQGRAAGLEPNAYFDSHWYTRTYEIQGDAMAPLLDYLENGVKLGRNPSPWFDVEWYLAANPDIKQAEGEPLAHYLGHGRHEGRAPTRAVHLIQHSDLLDLAFYNLQLEQPCTDLLSAAEHYLREGTAAGLNPNPYFDTAWYRANYPELVETGRNPLVDFIERAPGYDRNPSEAFDCHWYFSRYPDVARTRINPLRHFMTDGAREGRVPSPFKYGDVTVQSRFANLLTELIPQDGEVHMQATFAIKPMADSLKAVGTVPSAALDARPQRRHDRGDSFPPKPYVASFQDVGIVGGTRLILADAGTMISDEISTFWTSPGWSVRPSDFQMTSTGALRLTVIRRYPFRIERGAHLMHEYAANYCHMITEVLPRLLAAEEIGFDPSLPLLIQEKLHPNLLSLIDILNPHRRQLIALKSRQLYKVGELHYLSDVASIQDVYKRKRHPEESVLHLGLLRQLAARVTQVLAPDTPKPWRRLYVRRGNHYRGLTNENAVEDLLLTHGFEVVLLDGLSLAAQVRLFRQAAIVIAPTGAALTNILWCQPQTQVCTLSAQHDAMPTEIWEQIGAASGCMVKSLSCKRTFNLDGDYSLHDDYSVDLVELQQNAQALIERQPSSDR